MQHQKQKEIILEAHLIFRGIIDDKPSGILFAMALCLACSKIPGCGSLSDVFDTLVNSIPIVICAIAAKQVFRS